ncbi:MAG: glycerate kinase [Actinomycetota bacterium]|nr:glycerate kinase [Actinomycetota bacterium]
MHILIAPDKFKGTLTAVEVAHAMRAGVSRAQPDASVELCPVADGGDGTAETLCEARGGTRSSVVVTGPLGVPVEAPLFLLTDGRVVIEMAQASGLALLGGKKDPLRASSVGTGELLGAALDLVSDDGEVLVAIGGSASTDGGTGAASAGGWRFLDHAGRDLDPGGGALVNLAAIERPEAAHGAAITGISDVANPLLGSTGAARVFGPQKGASAAEVELLERGLGVLAERIAVDLGIDVTSISGGGAAGGMGAGLVAFFGAVLEPGFGAIAAAVDLEAALGRADLVLTGEGSLDQQSLAGKAPIGVARMALAAGVPCLVIAGRVSLERSRLAEVGVIEAVDLVSESGERRALDKPSAAVADAAAALLDRYPDS